MFQRQAAGAPSTSFDELSALLSREREVLGLILQGLSDARDDDERDLLLRSISSLELHRAISARAVAFELGMDREPTLRDLVDLAPPAWRACFDEHRVALELLSKEVARLVRPSGADLRREGNVVAFPTAGRGLQRSLLDFLA